MLRLAERDSADVGHAAFWPPRGAGAGQCPAPPP